MLIAQCTYKLWCMSAIKEQLFLDSTHTLHKSNLGMLYIWQVNY